MEYSLTGVFITLTSFCLSGVRAWPEGTYGIPMASKGCPITSTFNWETGSRTQMTEQGSHASNPIHLAGIDTSDSKTVIQNFCMKTSWIQDGNHEFTAGRYCVFKKGTCPVGFREGWIYWDDNAPLLNIFDKGEQQTSSGTLPDGEYNANTKIWYCCRNDGPTRNKLKLPTEEPFFLLKYGDGDCQQVQGMDATEEWVWWADETNFNLNGRGGLHPRLIRSRYPGKYTKLYYCYYTPQPPNKSLKTALTVIYGLAGAVGGILFILIIICIIQKICNRKRDPYGDTNTENAQREHMLHFNGGAGAISMTGTTDLETSVIYRPSNGHIKLGAVGGNGDEESSPGGEAELKLPAYPGPPLNPTPPYSLHSSSSEGASPPVISSATVTPPTAPPFGDEQRPLSTPPTYEDVLREKERENSENSDQS